MLKRIVWGITIVLMVTSLGSAYPRKVFYEKFTNASCTPCANAAPIFADFYDEHADDMVTVSVHVWWPGANDPWYVHMTNPATDRVQYYGVEGVPYCVVDGITELHPGNEALLINALNTRLEEDSPINMTVLSFGGDGDIATLMVIVEAEEDVTGNYRIRTYLASIFENYNAPNGQTEWHFDALDMAPDADGIEFSIEAGEVQTYQFDYPWDEDYDSENLKVVAFVQNDDNHEVIQSSWDDFNIAGMVDLSAEKYSIYTNCGDEAAFDFNISNLGLEPDTYEISVEIDAPQDWSCTYTTPEGTFDGNSTIALDNDEGFDGNLNIFPSDIPAESGIITLTVASTNIPQLSTSAQFFVLNSSDLVLINDEIEGLYSEYYTDAINNIDGPACGVWKTSSYQIDYEGFAENPPTAMIWSMGDREDLDPAHLTFMTEFVATGGNLFANGSLIAPLLNDTELISMMGTDYRGQFAALTRVYGADGDVIGDGIDLTLEGGDAADNLGRPCYFQNPDQENPYSATCFWITPNNTNAMVVRNEGEGYRTLVMGFPFETINNQTDRNDLMERISDFIMVDMGGVGPLHVDIQGRYFELVSTCLTPENLLIDQIFGNIDFLSIVYQNNGDIYIPRLNMNSIGDMDLSQAYRVFALDDAEWVIDGEDVDLNMEFNLQGGRYNWLAYPVYRPAPVEVMLSSIEDYVEIISSDDGRVWIPGLVNSMGNMLPGEGYMIYPNQDVTFQYTDALMMAGDFTDPVTIPECEDSPQATGLPYTVLVGVSPLLQEYNPTVVEIYDGSTLVGKGMIMEDLPQTPVIAWEGSQEYGVDGFTPGNDMEIRVLAADGSCLNSYVNGTVPAFGEGAYANIQLDLDTNSLPRDFEVAKAYPNPFNPTVTIPFAIPNSAEVRISIFNVLGQKIYQAKQNYSAGHHNFIFDASAKDSELVSGMYFLNISYQGQVNTQKLMLLK